jgi:hypothetical protein
MLRIDRGHALGEDLRRFRRAEERRVPDGVERDAGEPVRKERGLAYAARREGSVFETVFGVLVLAVANEVDVVGHR